MDKTEKEELQLALAAWEAMAATIESIVLLARQLRIIDKDVRRQVCLTETLAHLRQAEASCKMTLFGIQERVRLEEMAQAAAADTRPAIGNPNFTAGDMLDRD